MMEYKEIVEFIKKLYKKEKVPLHEPVFIGNEKKYLLECIDTTYVSYVGEFVNRFEKQISDYTGAKYAIAVVNGTVGLYISLKILKVGLGDEVITQPLTFVATANAISHTGATPVFVDVDKDTLGMSPESFKDFLGKYASYKNGQLINKQTGRRIACIIPVHVFGHPCRIDEIIEIAENYELQVIEDATEALGSFYKGRHCGTFGKIGVFSFNGNKIITTGGGGMIITNDEELANKIRHITTTAKVPHPYNYFHDEVGYNYRMPNVNAALGVAQMEYLDIILRNKRELAMVYEDFFKDKQMKFVKEPKEAKSNYWLNAILLTDRKSRDEFLEYTNSHGVHTRPAWVLMYKLPMYKDCFRTNTDNAECLEERLVNLPSGVVIWKW